MLNTSGNTKFSVEVKADDYKTGQAVYVQKSEASCKTNRGNYDYYTYTTGKNSDRKAYNAKLSGRKVYCLGDTKTMNVAIPKPTEQVRKYLKQNHENAADCPKYIKDYFQAVRKDCIEEYKLNMTSKVRILEDGTCKFKVYFDNVTKEELTCLIFCLALQKDIKKEETVYHRIGRGKPYGMGAVEIKIDKIYKLEGERITREIETCAKSDYSLGEYPKYEKAHKPILRYSRSLRKDPASVVDYPTLAGQPEIFRWFRKNRGNNPPKVKIEHTLPDI